MQPLTQRLPRTQKSAVSPSGRRAAFSLIELMVVIVIIAILMSLILVGVRGAMGTVRNATVTVEFKNLEKHQLVQDACKLKLVKYSQAHTVC